MKTPLIITFFVLTLLFSCDNSTENTQDEKKISHIDTLQQDSSGKEKTLEEILNAIPKKLKPIFGHRFIISGDFDGDGKKEKLIEHFFSKLDNKETSKFYDNLSDYDQLVFLTISKEPISFVSSNNNLIDTLHISSGGQLLGLSYLKNEGDLNGDGTDEVSYVVSWADWSELNTWHIMTYKNKKWTELYSFEIWDWQLPDLPKSLDRKLFELEQKNINTTNDTINNNKQIEKEQKKLKSLVKKIKTNKIQVIFRNDEGQEDTIIVDLKRLKRKE